MGESFKTKRLTWMAVEEASHGGPRFIRAEALEDITGDEIVPIIAGRVQKGSRPRADGGLGLWASRPAARL